MSSLENLSANFHSRRAIPGFTTDLSARLALDEQTKADAYGVRHASYLSGGFIDPLPGGLFSDAFDLNPNNYTVVIYKLNRPVASVRLCVRFRTCKVPFWTTFI